MRFSALLPRQRRALAGVAMVAALTVPFSATPSGAAVHCNTAPVVFTPPGQPTFAVLPWQPYPSTINVQGESGVVTDVNVTFNDFTYTFPEDVDVLLVAPDGTTRLLVFSDIGGNNDDAAESVTDVDLTFDDEAAAPPPTDSQLVSGTYRPVDDDNDLNEVFGPDQFPGAPNNGDPGTATSLSVFDGINPNGTWSLYVVDDEPGPPTVGDFGGGWCLNITTSGTPTSTTPTTGPTSSTPTSSTLPTTSTTLGTTTTQATTSTTQATTSTTLGTTTTQPTTTTTMAPTTTTSTTLPATTTTSSTTTTTPAGTCGGLTPTIVGTSAGETINGTAGDDVIVGQGGSDTINGGGGNDTICGGDGNDQITGGEGNDRLFGDAGNDRLVGGNGNDSLDGGALFDQCFGDAGTDTAAACEQVFTVP